MIENEFLGNLVGYRATIEGVDVHIQHGYCCLVWGPSRDEWDGWNISSWLLKNPNEAYVIFKRLPRRRFDAVYPFVRALAQLHQ